MAYEELKVSGEDAMWFCARHKSTQTRLRCGRCEKPICPKCTVMAPTGARCRECVSNRDAHMYQVAPKHFALAFGASVVAGALGSVLLGFAGVFWLWALVYAPAIGPVLGRLVTKITGGKRGAKVALVVSLGLLCGALAGGMGSAYASMMRPSYDPFPPYAILQPTLPVLFSMAASNLPLWIFVIIAIIGVWWWLK